MSPDEISRKRKLAAAEKCFHGFPKKFMYFREYIGEGARSGERQGGHKPASRHPLVAATGLVGPL